MTRSPGINQFISFGRRAVPAAVRQGRIPTALDRLERFAGADAAIDTLRRSVQALPVGGGRDVLHGRWLGHPVHPMMVQVPVGTWLSAAVLDLMPGRRAAARTLVGVGLAAAGPAALAGLVDWAELHREQMRVGLVHAAANVSAVCLYTVSLAARLRGREALGRAFGFGGLAAVAAGGALGGHLAYRQASAVNHAEAVPHLVEPGWHALGDVAEFPVGEPVRRSLGEVPVLVVREDGGSLHVLADQCSHMAGPLSQGTVSDGCVRCPWHGSVFRLADGHNIRGPATAPQPAFDATIVDGRVRVRLRQAPDLARRDGWKGKVGMDTGDH